MPSAGRFCGGEAFMGGRNSASICLVALTALFVLPPSAQSKVQEYPVYLRSGETVVSYRQPLSMYGRVGVYDEHARLSWLSASTVDLGRSRDAWVSSKRLEDLDSDPWQGKIFPTLKFVDSQGIQRQLPDGSKPHVFVEIWSPF
jgi:hypothetical protein